jgi:hypothetical protein
VKHLSSPAEGQVSIVCVASMLHGLAGVVCNSLVLLGIGCDTLQHEI